MTDVIVKLRDEHLTGQLLGEAEGFSHVRWDERTGRGQVDLTAWLPSECVTKIRTFVVGEQAVTSCNHTYTIVHAAHGWVVCDKGNRLGLYRAQELRHPNEVELPLNPEDDEDDED